MRFLHPAVLALALVALAWGGGHVLAFTADYLAPPLAGPARTPASVRAPVRDARMVYAEPGLAVWYGVLAGGAFVGGAGAAGAAAAAGVTRSGGLAGDKAR